MELISYADSSEQDWISMPRDVFSSSTTNFPKPQHVTFPTEQNDFRSFSEMEDEWYLVTTSVPPSTKDFSKQTVSHSKTSTKCLKDGKIFQVKMNYDETWEEIL